MELLFDSGVYNGEYDNDTGLLTVYNTKTNTQSFFPNAEVHFIKNNQIGRNTSCVIIKYKYPCQIITMITDVVHVVSMPWAITFINFSCVSGSVCAQYRANGKNNIITKNLSTMPKWRDG